MTVPVHFPDGTIRQVPGQLKHVSSSGSGAAARFEQVPLHCDPLWRFERVGDRWIAERRKLVVTALRPAVEDWWHSIACMADDRAGRAPDADRSGRREADGKMRPAA